MDHVVRAVAQPQRRRVAAHNIVADFQGDSRRELPLTDLAAICVLDAGNNGIVFKADKVLGDGDHARVTVDPQAHRAKLAFERYFLASRTRGLVSL